MYETLDQLVRGVIKPSDLPPSQFFRQHDKLWSIGTVDRLVFIFTRDQFQDHGDQVDKSWVEHHTMNFTSHGETFLPDEEADSGKHDFW